MVQIRINIKNRVDRYGRLLGKVFHRGLDMGDVMLRQGRVKPYGSEDGEIPNIGKIFSLKQWFSK